MTRRRL